MYISFNGGDNWQSFQLNLPVVPITDLAFQKRENELVVATQGRAFWILDDLPLIYQLADCVRGRRSICSSPRTPIALCAADSACRLTERMGQNPPPGAVVYYSFTEKPQGEVTLEFLDNSRQADSQIFEQAPPTPRSARRKLKKRKTSSARVRRADRVPAEAGLQPLRLGSALSRMRLTFPGLIMWAGTYAGRSSFPALTRCGSRWTENPQTQTFEVKKDPRLSTTPRRLRAAA